MCATDNVWGLTCECSAHDPALIVRRPCLSLFFDSMAGRGREWGGEGDRMGWAGGLDVGKGMKIGKGGDGLGLG